MAGNNRGTSRSGASIARLRDNPGKGSRAFQKA